MITLQPYQHWLETQQAAQTRRVLTTPPAGLLDFSHNDYLGLSQHPALIEASVKATQDHGTSVASSPLVSGHTVLANQLAQAVCQWTNAPHSLIYSSGYQLNQSVLKALGALPDVVFLLDKYCHASLVDGVLASGARWHRFAHNDVGHAERLMRKIRQKHPQTPVWLVTESVFSMDGDTAPLQALIALCQQYQVFSYLDEAHACGLYGASAINGRFSGLAEAVNVEADITLRMGTFSKAMGGFGAWLVAQQPVWTDYLTNASRGFIYSTGLPPAVLAANIAAIQTVQSEPEHRLQLIERIRLVVTDNDPLSPTAPTGSPIVPIHLADNAQALALSEQLATQGFWVKAIRQPTVPTPRLRLTLSARQSLGDLARLLVCVR